MFTTKAKQIYFLIIARLRNVVNSFASTSNSPGQPKASDQTEFQDPYQSKKANDLAAEMEIVVNFWNFLEEYSPQLEFSSVVECFRVLTREYFKSQLLREWDRLEEYIFQQDDVKAPDAESRVGLKIKELGFIFELLQKQGVIPQQEADPISFLSFLQASSWLSAFIGEVFPQGNRSTQQGFEFTLRGDSAWLPNLEEDKEAHDQIGLALIKGVKEGVLQAIRQGEKDLSTLKVVADKLLGDEVQDEVQIEAQEGVLPSEIDELQQILGARLPRGEKFLAIAIRLLQLRAGGGRGPLEITDDELARLIGYSERQLERFIRRQRDPETPEEQRILRISSRAGTNFENLYELDWAKLRSLLER